MWNSIHLIRPQTVDSWSAVKWTNEICVGLVSRDFLFTPGLLSSLISDVMGLWIRNIFIRGRKSDWLRGRKWEELPGCKAEFDWQLDGM